MRLLTIAACAVVLLFGSLAGATPSFPSVTQCYLALSYTPACTLCHVGAEQRGTVTTPFGRSMIDRGLVANDEASLKHALDRMQSERVDSNGDGLADIDALRAGKDPNAGQEPPQYGIQCGFAASSGGLGSVGIALAAWIAWLVGQAAPVQVVRQEDCRPCCYRHGLDTYLRCFPPGPRKR
ncbi:MAG: hypothetical protein WCI05_05280 [Myxococcales bacterium]